MMPSDAEFDSLDAKTQRYLEVVTQKRHQSALDAWLKFVSVNDRGQHSLTVQGRIDLAQANAYAWVVPQ